MTIDLFSERTTKEPLGIFPAAEKLASTLNSFKGQILQSILSSIQNILTAKPAEKVQSLITVFLDCLFSAIYILGHLEIKICFSSIGYYTFTSALVTIVIQRNV